MNENDTSVFCTKGIEVESTQSRQHGPNPVSDILRCVCAADV